MAAGNVTFDTIAKAAYKEIERRGLPQVYSDRLRFEIVEIHSQGAERFWEEVVAEHKKFDSNPSGLLLPWLLKRLNGEADVDPIAARLERKEPIVLSSDYTYVTNIIKSCGKLPPDLRLDSDKPDIDMDCLPYARDHIKDYASRRYGETKVASVGTWQTYLFKQALTDAYMALGLAPRVKEGEEGSARGRIQELTKLLPDDVNEMRDGGYGVCKGKVVKDGVEKECGCKHNQLVCPSCGSEDTETPTLAKLIDEYEDLKKFIDENPEHKRVVDLAARLVGCIRNAGKHAGAVIIADRDLFGNVPMTFDRKSNQWVSAWTEGRSTQLSKFGYNKWDVLGLNTLQFIFEACKMITDNHGIDFGPGLEYLQYSDPENEIAGYYMKNGERFNIPLNDKKALQLANELKTDAVFQFDTDLAKRILSNGVRSFWDLLIFNAMGHPGPMQMIPDYVERRDDESWKEHEHELVKKILHDTCGVIVFQEQLAQLWQVIAGFTGPEAQDARKAVAKKWKDKLKPVRQKWIDGAKSRMGESEAIRWWDDIMAPFGRYAFNRSHSVAYCLWAYKCLWFKAHFAEEWWASVMGHCHQEKLERYMSSARSEGVKFGEISINRMTVKPAANSGKNAINGVGQVAIGLINLKQVGDKLAEEFSDDKVMSYTDIDDFIAKKGKSKVLLERLIKLGAFRVLHPNIKATWMWYMHEYGSGDIIFNDTLMGIGEFGQPVVVEDQRYERKISAKALHNHHIALLLTANGWSKETIQQEQQRQANEYRKLYPKRSKIPAKILKWKPTLTATREQVMGLYSDDYDLAEILEFEKQFLGYYWHSICDLFHMTGKYNIKQAKAASDDDHYARLEGVITKVIHGKTSRGSDMVKLIVTDGTEECMVIVWEQDKKRQDRSVFTANAGVRMSVNYDESRGTFTLANGCVITKLMTSRAWAEVQDDSLDPVS